MADSSFNVQQNKQGIMDDHLDSSSSVDVLDSSTVVFTLSDLLVEDATSLSSSSYSSSLTLSSSSSDDDHHQLGGTSIRSSSSSNGPLYEMSSLIIIQQLIPIKRGLSEHFQGKSQSFTSKLSEVRCLEDLAKPENPYKKKKLKTCKSYGTTGLMYLDHQMSNSTDDHHHHHHHHHYNKDHDHN